MRGAKRPSKFLFDEGKRFHVKPTDRPEVPQRLMYATRLEVAIVQEALDKCFQGCADIADALCDAAHTLILDVDNILLAARVLSVEGATIRSIAAKVQREGRDAAQ